MGTWSGVLGAWPGVLEAVGAWSDVMGHGQIVWRGVVCCGVKRGRGAWWGVVGRAVACCGVLWRGMQQAYVIGGASVAGWCGVMAAPCAWWTMAYSGKTFRYSIVSETSV